MFGEGTRGFSSLQGDSHYLETELIVQGPMDPLGNLCLAFWALGKGMSILYVNI